MSKKNLVKLSEAELLERIARSEKRELRLKIYGFYGAAIGLIGAIIFKLLDSEMLMCIFLIVLFGGLASIFLGDHVYKKSRSLVQEQLDDFFEAELERAFGSRLSTQEMRINKSFLKEIRPVEPYWDECQVWRFYEGNYNGTHFSAANVELYELRQLAGEDDIRDATETVFEGLVLRCRDVCDPTLDIVLRGHGTDHRQSDLMDPAVFRQHFSVCTAGDQPADDLVTPQLRELVLKLETLDNCEMVDLEVQQIRKRLQGAAILERKHKKLGAGLVDSVYEDIRKMEAHANYTPLTSLILRNGEATLAIDGYAFAEGLPSGGQNLQNPALIRKRFTVSLPPVCEMIDILRDSGGKL